MMKKIERLHGAVCQKCTRDQKSAKKPAVMATVDSKNTFKSSVFIIHNNNILCKNRSLNYTKQYENSIMFLKM
jgi:hypothetical protein